MTIVNSEQAEYWQSEAGRKWITYQAAFDTLLSGALEACVEVARPEPGETVLDVGCGTGASTLALASKVGPQGHVTGLDISSLLLDHARSRSDAPNVEFVQADAQVHTPRRSFDLLFSRFGVMFFEDPVAAFANLRDAIKPGGRLAMICWQGMPDNPWFQIPFAAAVERLGRPSPLPENAPGPTAFKDVERVTGILTEAGWADARGARTEVDLIPPQELSDAADFAATIGPASRTLSEKNGTEADRAAIVEAIMRAFEDYRTPAGLRVPGRFVIYTARKG
ncbi:class I SAM-dependent methyltransferase [Roseovarius sp. SCSIO 43702]|uniref:class I SAM-dependent methyltransferase n=1 Tax=Roseovarius sp. SCSIO 43702 TaxID=2823043 RepID=UPI001C7326B4|nr:class I SAM-dependent methyltransferase [Roseovarius sp. SCSIO 43702]QYX56189.1 class I SAM-dependent methyltransferase [Roseovarius sp. SCSIO 43702]